SGAESGQRHHGTHVSEIHDHGFCGYNESEQLQDCCDAAPHDAIDSSMELDLTHLIRILACFAIGAIPFAKVAMWGTGIDITKVGSKNPGFRNVSRVASRWRAAICLIGDLGKGF